MIGRRKPLVLLGYGVSAFNKVMFPFDGVVSVVLVVGYVIGPVAGMVLMATSGDNFRLVFQLDVIPAIMAMLFLFFGISETVRR